MLTRGWRGTKPPPKIVRTSTLWSSLEIWRMIENIMYVYLHRTSISNRALSKSSINCSSKRSLGLEKQRYSLNIDARTSSCACARSQPRTCSVFALVTVYEYWVVGWVQHRLHCFAHNARVQMSKRFFVPLDRKLFQLDALILRELEIRRGVLFLAHIDYGFQRVPPGMKFFWSGNPTGIYPCGLVQSSLGGKTQSPWSVRAWTSAKQSA